ncbi:unnamed protein product [marine sediment metagenome]|uniref:Uncharacterized protein n=1 Tax=marine sediment metagenome TaxID=412755 RepID=X0SKB9_9ZZZZ
MVLKDFDIAAEAGGPLRAVVKQFDNVPVKEALVVELVPARGETVICGVELLATKQK